MSKSKSVKQAEIVKYFSTLAGPLTKIKNKDYSVTFKKLVDQDTSFNKYWARAVAYGALCLVILFNAIALHPSHWIIRIRPDSDQRLMNLIMLICLGFLQAFVLIGTLSAARSTVKARNPMPVTPPKKLRVAFVTTRAPGEPIELVENTLRAACRVQYKRGLVDVWLLDETDEPELKALCEKLGVRHFSRKGIEQWNTPKPESKVLAKVVAGRILWAATFGRKAPYQKQPTPNAFLAARTKHGNFNAWRAYLAQNSIAYDILAGVDTDHVPQPNYLQRVLGYFRDPNVAYVVGPQVYGNYTSGLNGLVTRWAESQASFFQSTIQRAGNASTSPMFVGTNYAVRMPVLDQIGGFQPCITEDMATGLAIHSNRNPETNKRWKSIYTPDVLAIGEGPDSWGPYFTQQWRWAAGTFDTWRKSVWRVFYKLTFPAMVHYFLMLTYYPIAAMTWLLGFISSIVYLITGATAILAPWSVFVSLYGMTVVMQMSLYFWNRRFNVSPHEPQGSYGVAGMMASVVTAPIYFSALTGILLGKKASFVVTTKGGSNLDRLKTFKTHIIWSLLLIGFITYGYRHDHTHPAMMIWIYTLLAICLLPVVLGMLRTLLASPPRFSREAIVNGLRLQKNRTFGRAASTLNSAVRYTKRSKVLLPDMSIIREWLTNMSLPVIGKSASQTVFASDAIEGAHRAEATRIESAQTGGSEVSDRDEISDGKELTTHAKSQVNFIDNGRGTLYVINKEGEYRGL